LQKCLLRYLVNQVAGLVDYLNNGPARLRIVGKRSCRPSPISSDLFTSWTAVTRWRVPSN
jgi:hypothetical protein